MGRRRPLPTQPSQENLLSPRSLSHSMSSFNPSPRSLVESLDLSTAEETPRDDMAVSWPMSPTYQKLNEEGTPRSARSEAWSERTPTPAEVRPLTPITATPMSTSRDSTETQEGSGTGSGETRVPEVHIHHDGYDDEDVRDPPPGEGCLPVLDHDPLSPIPDSGPPNLAPPEMHLDLDLNESMKSNASLSSIVSGRTPTPTARTPRGGFMWRPIGPGYRQPDTGDSKPTVVIKQTLEVQRTVSEPESSLKDSIPILPKGLAIACFVLNVLFPGLGTLVAGLSVLCCAKPRPYEADRWNSIFVNCWVSLLQAMTTMLFLLGWIWSIMWGAAFVQISNQERDRLVIKRAEDGAGVAESRVDDGMSHVSHRISTRAISSSTTMATSTTTVSYEGDSSLPLADDYGAIIILQEAPVIVNHDSLDPIIPTQIPRPQRTLNRYNPRHQRALRRQNTEEELPPLYLTPETLESIVIHNAHTLPQGEGEEGAPGAHRDNTTLASSMGYTDPKARSSRLGSS